MKIMACLRKNEKVNDLIEKYYQYKFFRDVAKTKNIVDKKRLKAFKDTKCGKRCFIIGNGPSLSIEDLNMLKNEDCFAVNRIYKIYDQTEWRPTFYCSSDARILEEISEDLGDFLEESKAVFLSSTVASSIKKEIKENTKVNFFYVNLESFAEKYPYFSSDISREIFEGYTVAYICIQIAVYMGYSEIYLLGTDHNYSVNLNSSGDLEEKKDVVNYMKGLEGKLVYPPQLEKSTLAFEKSRIECEARGVIIKNATRGGKLEVFERVDFETLFV